jgi:hypothetical protein
MINVSSSSDESTARTNIECCEQRAQNLSIFGIKAVLELCVGPSLKYLEQAYNKYNIKVTGNDIDYRWKKYYPGGKWIVGDALTVDLAPFDAVVFAPPLGAGCSGRRDDALSIDAVRPSYNFFNSRLVDFFGVAVMVLPARCVATRQDRTQLHKLLNSLTDYEVVRLTAGKRNITKYVDIYIDRRAK